MSEKAADDFGDGLMIILIASTAIAWVPIWLPCWIVGRVARLWRERNPAA